jgi:hypothetical protein
MNRQLYLRNALNVRLDDASMAWLVEAAAEMDLRPSVLARRLIRQAAAKDALTRGHPDVLTKDHRNGQQD